MKGGGAIRGGGGGGGGLMRTRLRLPVVLLSCSLFFLAGFFGSLLFTQDPQGEEELERPLPRERLMEAVWPEMAYGESGEPAPSLIPYQILSWQPRALYFPQFATSKQCENIVITAKERLRPSTLALRKGETEETTKGIRTSSGTFLSADEDPTGTLAEVEKKIAKATMIPRSHGEPFNVLRYEIGQKYASHYDAFDPAQYGPQKSQRVASFLLYLTDVEEGGETMFPYENGENMDIGYDFEKCIGLKVKPRKGDGLLFYSLMVNGTIDPVCSCHSNCHIFTYSEILFEVGNCVVAKLRNLDKSRDVYCLTYLPKSSFVCSLCNMSLELHMVGSNIGYIASQPNILWAPNFVDMVLQTSLHGSCPVIKGEKWVATKWIRDKMV